MSSRFAAFRIATGALVGAYLGMRIERHNQLHCRPVKPGLNSFHVVEAAAPLPAPVGGDEPGLIFRQKSERINQIMQHGYPSLDTIRTYDNFVLSYDRRNRTANWVFEHLTPELLQDPPSGDKTDRSKCEFKEDKSIHEFFRASNNDYRNSGLDRGHLGMFHS